MPAHSELFSPLERQLLLQLGERLRHARKSRAMSSVELAGRVGISRTTLRAVERGDPSPTFGTYVRVLSALGLVADLVLVAATAPRALLAKRKSAPRHDEVSRGPLSLHRAQDLQSLLMHQEAVRLLCEDPSLQVRLQQTLSRWLERDDPNSRPLLERWVDIVARQDWSAAVADTEEAQQLRQASPLATLLTEATRLAVIARVRAMKEQSRHAEA